MTTNNTGKGLTYEVIGAVSWGIGPCASQKFPGVYAKITTSLDWIEKTTQNDWNSCPRAE